MVLIGGWFLGGMGLLCCIATACVQTKTITNPILQVDFIQKPHFKKKQVCLLWLGQIVLVGLSFVLFHFLETQTQINTRLSFVETGYIVGVLQQQPFSLGVVPFVIYGVLGVGLAYFSVCLGAKPLLARAFSFYPCTGPKRVTKLVLFWQNFVSVVIEVVIVMPFVLVSSFALLWLCETVNAYFGLDSLFSVPLRTIFILGLMIFVFQRINKQLIAWMGRHQISVGQVLMIYILAFAFFVSWLHGSSDWLTLAIQIPSGEGEKSYLSGIFSEKSLQERIQYLIWGWWSIWIPWMASWVARSSIGFSIPRALMQALLLPTVVFGWGMQYMGLVEWASVYQWLQLPSMQLLVLAVIFLGMWVMWSETRTLGDVFRCAMLPIGQISNRSLTRWMTVLLFWLTCYIPGWFMLGWLPMQFTVTLSGLFMMGAEALLIAAWGASLYRLWVLKKCRVLAQL
jgi:hypothetical protein